MNLKAPDPVFNGPRKFRAAPCSSVGSAKLSDCISRKMDAHILTLSQVRSA